MPEDDRQVDALALADEREIRSLGRHRRGALGIESGQAESPTEELADGVDGFLRGILGGVVAHHGNADGVLVESACVCALNCLVEATGTTFEDLAVLVDEGVVADIAPAQRLRVVRVDSADDFGRFGLGVIVATCGVVHGGTTDEVVVRRCGATNRLVGTPLRAGDHVGARVTGDRSGDIAERRVGRRCAGSDEHGADVVDRRSQLLCRIRLVRICCRICRCRLGRSRIHRSRIHRGRIEWSRILLAQWCARRRRGVTEGLLGGGGPVHGCITGGHLDHRNLGYRRDGRTLRRCAPGQRRQQYLHGLGHSDENRFGALLCGRRGGVVGVAVHRRGLEPRAPGSVLELAANLRGRAVQFLGRQRHHAERGVLRDFLDGGTERRASGVRSLGVDRRGRIDPGNRCLRGRVPRRRGGEPGNVRNFDRRDHDRLGQRQVFEIGEPQIRQR